MKHTGHSTSAKIFVSSFVTIHHPFTIIRYLFAYSLSPFAYPLSPTLFLDRDGVLIHNRADYVRTPHQAVLIPGAPQAVALAHTHGWRVIVVTNQSGVGRGLITLDDLHAIHAYIEQAVRAAGGELTRIYICPHRPDEHCACRKPRPGLLLTAAAELGLDLGAAYMVGDSFIDVQAAQAAGVRPIFVQTGLPERLAHEQARAAAHGAPIYADLLTAVRVLIGAP